MLKRSSRSSALIPSRRTSRTSRRPRSTAAQSPHGYALSQWRRKRVEQAFGWLKTVALLRQKRHCGGARVGWMFTLAAAAYHLVRMRTLTVVTI
jgi:hypothetical protein